MELFSNYNAHVFIYLVFFCHSRGSGPERILSPAHNVIVVLEIPSNYQYTVKKVIDFPVPSRDVTYQTLPGDLVRVSADKS